MAHWIQQARDWAKIGLSNPRNAAKLRARRDALFDASITAGGLDKMQSASKNGVSTTMDTAQGMSVTDEFAALTRACEWIDAGCVPSQSTSFARF